MTERSLLLIKPNAVVHHHVGQIIAILEEAGFQLADMKEFQFDPELAREFYTAHIGKGFFDKLVEFMCSGATVGLIVEKDDAIAELRELIGEVDPARRKPGTIRDLYAEGITENAVHASDSPESAQREIAIIFGNNHN